MTASVSRDCLDTSVDLSPGSINVVDRDSWQTFGGGFDLPPPTSLISRVEDAINRIPRVNVELEPGAAFGVEYGRRDCCKDGQLTENGERYGQGQLSAAGTVDVQLWGPPTIEKEFDWGVVSGTVLFEAGVFINSTISAALQAGYRWNDCKPEECAFGVFKAGIDIVTQARFEAIAFGRAFGYEYELDDISFKITAPLKVGVSGSLSYNGNDNCNGFSGGLGVDDVVFIVELSVAGVTLSYQHVIWESTLKI
jgi:hypothetical protein